MASLGRSTPLKIVLATLALLGSASVLAFNVHSALADDDEPRFDGSTPARALDETPWARAPQAGAGGDATALAAGREPAADPGADAAGAGPTASPPPKGATSRAASETEPRPGSPLDLESLFDKLLEREQRDQAGTAALVAGGGLLAPASPSLDHHAALARHELRGIVSTQQGGVALVDGHLLREGDELPGSSLRIRSIAADRLLLDAPGSERPLVLRLQPLQPKGAGMAPSGSTPAGAGGQGPSPGSSGTSAANDASADGLFDGSRAP